MSRAPYIKFAFLALLFLGGCFLGPQPEPPDIDQDNRDDPGAGVDDHGSADADADADADAESPCDPAAFYDEDGDGRNDCDRDDWTGDGGQAEDDAAPSPADGGEEADVPHWQQEQIPPETFDFGNRSDADSIVIIDR